MHTILILAVLGLGAPIAADLPDSTITVEVVRGDSTYVFVRHMVTRADTLKGFSLGGTTDIPAGEIERGKRITASLQDNQYSILQGTASSDPWIAHREKEEHKEDVDAAHARAQFVSDELRSGKLASSVLLDQPFRGVIIYTVAVERRNLSPFLSRSIIAAAHPDTIYLSRESEPRELSIGLEGGYSLLSTNDLTIATPTVGLVLQKWNGRLDLGIGWWPSGENELGNLADASVSGTLTWFPRGFWLGPFVGWVGATQLVRQTTEYLQLSNGPTVGATARFNRGLTGAFRIGYARVSTDELNRAEQWTNGFFLAAQVGKVF